MEFKIDFTREDLAEFGINIEQDYLDYHVGSVLRIYYTDGYPDLTDTDLDSIYELDDSYEDKLYDMVMKAVEDYE